jgi:hypothetical protein
VVNESKPTKHVMWCLLRHLRIYYDFFAPWWMMGLHPGEKLFFSYRNQTPWFRLHLSSSINLGKKTMGQNYTKIFC